MRAVAHAMQIRQRNAASDELCADEADDVPEQTALQRNEKRKNERGMNAKPGPGANAR